MFFWVNRFWLVYINLAVKLSARVCSEMKKNKILVNFFLFFIFYNEFFITNCLFFFRPTEILLRYFRLYYHFVSLILMLSLNLFFAHFFTKYIFINFDRSTYMYSYETLVLNFLADDFSVLWFSIQLSV